LPQAAVAVPGWQVPLESQHPWLHVRCPQGIDAPLLEADEPLELLELLGVHPPPVHVCVEAVQSAHVAPPVPHAVFIRPG
jgi:hypothetical protein